MKNSKVENEHEEQFDTLGTAEKTWLLGLQVAFDVRDDWVVDGYLYLRDALMNANPQHMYLDLIYCLREINYRYTSREVLEVFLVLMKHLVRQRIEKATEQGDIVEIGEDDGTLVGVSRKDSLKLMGRSIDFLLHRDRDKIREVDKEANKEAVSSVKCIGCGWESEVPTPTGTEAGQVILKQCPRCLAAQSEEIEVKA